MGDMFWAVLVRHMKPYTFYIHDGVHEVPSFDFVWCENERAAADHAHVLLQRYPEYLLVEVFDGSAWRVQVRRDGQLCGVTPARPDVRAAA
jgi:hypothetical protein